MVSTTLINRGGMQIGPVSGWSDKQKLFAYRAARRALDGVGDDTHEVVDSHGTIVSIRRLCRVDERNLVTEPYLDPKWRILD